MIMHLISSHILRREIAMVLKGMISNEIKYKHLGDALKPLIQIQPDHYN